MLTLLALGVAPDEQLAGAKQQKAPRPEPDLKILELKVTPTPFHVSQGPLEFSAVIQLPKDLTEATLLEVSSFLTSPSRTSIRFLSTRQPVLVEPAPNGTREHPHLPVILSWDGMDHKKTPAAPGLYQYELRAKLLANGEKGPRTLMVSWPKRGTVELK
ncbi:conserved exported protein of unknown function [Nitrospira sp. KM1]|uniref:hypothetical protein n=1 Tax=Nitrospira sp. KM1 TaxID=1936990 RepID=UPI0013A7B5FC|nr:hypothetical protein [Nitrospira sp. KM1]BCA55684.1 conserved exported protein of unknown function [Nitrospira sp. KM1]